MLSEDNVIEKLSDERYARMSADYEAEQKELLTKVDESERLLSEAEQKTADMRMFSQRHARIYGYERVNSGDCKQADTVN